MLNIFFSSNRISQFNDVLLQALWIFLVFLSFLTAGYLINDSFTSWAISPTISSVKTFPISAVQFPEVTVCPPRGTNTALNYDLRRAQHKILDEDIRKNLTIIAFEQMHKYDHENYIDAVTNMIDEEDLAMMYSGHRQITILDPYILLLFLRD